MLLPTLLVACGGPMTADGGGGGDGGRTDGGATMDVARDVVAADNPPPIDNPPPPDAAEDVVAPPDAPPDAPPPPDVACTAPQVNCGGACVNTQSDSANCGSCGHACAAAEMCAAGACVPTCAAPRMMCGATCVDTSNDPANCGACGTACPTGAMCMAGACACATGQVFCGTGAARACVNTQTDSNNCGTCGTVCPMGQTCVTGSCQITCPTGQTRCVAGGVMSCVDTQSDPANCGACGTACPAGQMCVTGSCQITCPTGQTRCVVGTTMTCRALQTDPANCGACGTVCAAGQVCTAGVCTTPPPPANDTCATAAPIVLGAAGATTTVMGNTTTATASAMSCAADSRDVYYSFTLTQREVVYIDTFGSTYDTRVGFHDACATAATACNDDSGCGGLQSQTAAVFGPGTHFIEVGGFSTSAGAFTLNVQHFPVGSGVANRITPSGTTQTASGTTAGAGSLAGSCGASGSSGEDTYFFTTCPGAPAQTFHATTCPSGGGMGTYDTVLYERSNGVAGDVCNDDAGFTCSVRSSVTAQIPAGAGLHTVTVDGFGGSVGMHTVAYRFGCTAGFTTCGSGATTTCLETTRLQTDNNNCGACGTVCAAGTACATGSCRPANDLCSAAAALAWPAANATTTVNGTITNATPEATMPPRGANGDVWYTFTIPAADGRSLVYFDTFGAGTTFDTVIYLTGACGTAATASNDDSGCGGLSSQLVAVLDPGTYHLAVTPFSAGATGTFTLNMQRMPALGTVPITANISGGAGAFTLAAASTAGQPTVATTPSCFNSPARLYPVLACPTDAAGAFTVNTCTAGMYDTELFWAQRGTATTACNDDSCGLQSSITTAVTAGPGLRGAVYVGGFGGGSGTFTLAGTRP